MVVVVSVAMQRGVDGSHVEKWLRCYPYVEGGTQTNLRGVGRYVASL